MAVSNTTGAAHFRHPPTLELDIWPVPPCGAKSLRVDSVCQRFSKPIQRLRIVHLASLEERKTPDRWGERPGVGVLLRGAGGNSFLSSAPGVRPACISVAALRR